MIVLRNITKAYGDETAVSDVSLEIRAGELFGLIGPDGAGKTTLLRILATLLVPDVGDVRIGDLNVVDDFRTLRRRLGYMPGRFSLYQDLTVLENLEFFATVFGTSIEDGYPWIRPIYEQLEPFKNRRAGALSGGMKQKLALSCALIHQPEVLLLDEPTTGVDAVSRREFWQNLAAIKESGVTILVSTPYMDEANQCDRVALMQDGKILEVDEPAAVAQRYGRPLLAVKADRRKALLDVLRSHPHVHSAYPFGEYVHVADRRSSGHPEEIAAYLRKHRFNDVVVRPVAPTIEDVFIDRMDATTGRGPEKA